MRVVTATEAKARLAELLRAVEGGETIAITRHDKAIVHLVPAEARDNAARAATVARFRRQRASWRRIEMSTEEILAARHEGHRW